MVPRVETHCPRCETSHAEVCPRCHDVHERTGPDGTVEPVACPHCGLRHQYVALPAGASCCARQIDRGHVCGKPTRPPEYRTFCRSDQDAVSDALDEIPELYVGLYLALEGARGGGLGEVHSNGFESRIPISAHISSLMQKFVGLHPAAEQNQLGSDRRLGVLMSWEDALRESLGFARRPIHRMRPITPKEEGWMRIAQRHALHTYAVPAGTAAEAIERASYQHAVERVMLLRERDSAVVEAQAGPTLSATCSFLKVHLTSLLDLSADAGNEIMDLREQALRALGRSRRDEFEAMPDAACQSCGLKMLYRRMGEDRVRCGSGKGCPDLTSGQYKMRTWREFGFAQQRTPTATGTSGAG